MMLNHLECYYIRDVALSIPKGTPTSISAMDTSRELNYDTVQIHSEKILGIGKVCKAKCGQLPCAAQLLHDTLFWDNDPGTQNLVTKFLPTCLQKHS
jgi:hypothetical protein